LTQWSDGVKLKGVRMMSNSIEQNTLNINLKTLDYCIEEAFKLNKEEKDCVIIYLVESNDG